MTIGRQSGWHRVTFAQSYTAPAKQRLAVGLQTAGASQYFGQLSKGTPRKRYLRRSCGGWTRGNDWTAGIRMHCGPGIAGTDPLISSATSPVIGQTFRVDLAQAQANSFAILITGISKTMWGPTPLPLNLAFLGAPGCALHVSYDFPLPVTTSAAGAASLPLAVPNSMTLVGARFFQQYVVGDPAANAAGLVFSGGADARVGGGGTAAPRPRIAESTGIAT